MFKFFTGNVVAIDRLPLPAKPVCDAVNVIELTMLDKLAGSWYWTVVFSTTAFASCVKFDEECSLYPDVRRPETPETGRLVEVVIPTSTLLSGLTVNTRDSCGDPSVLNGAVGAVGTGWLWPEGIAITSKARANNATVANLALIRPDEYKD